MRFKDLTAQDKQYIKTVHSNSDLSWQQRMSILTKKFQVSERALRYWISREGYSEYKEVDNEEIRQGKLRTYDPSKKRVLISWAQNATPVHKPFWENILTYAEFLDAEVGIIQGRYKVTDKIDGDTSDSWWDECFTVKNPDGSVKTSYLDGGRTKLNEFLEILGDIKILPTAANPLIGYESISGKRSSIIGHPRVHLKSLPVLNGHENKLLLTTGAVTMKNYSDTRVGAKSSFHHTYAFVIVEIKDDETFFIRQVTANFDGTFSDLCYHVDGAVYEVESSAAFIMGDIHATSVEPVIMESALKLCGKIKPERVVLHDVFDGDSVNHHENKDPIKSYERIKTGRNIVKKEIEGLKSFIDKYKLLQYNPIVVRSNHDIWADKWISEIDWKKDLVNSETYMEYALVSLKGDAPKGLIPYILEKEYGDKITCLGLDDSIKIQGWELGIHGHLGTHGSKGSFEQFRRLNTKLIIGDKHIPARLDGMLCVGTFSKLRMGYNKGASAWMHCGAVIHENGKAQLIIFNKSGEFTTFWNDRRDKGDRELDKRSGRKGAVGKNIRRKSKTKANR